MYWKYARSTKSELPFLVSGWLPVDLENVGEGGSCINSFHIVDVGVDIANRADELAVNNFFGGSHRTEGVPASRHGQSIEDVSVQLRQVAVVRGMATSA